MRHREVLRPTVVGVRSALLVVTPMHQACAFAYLRRLHIFEMSSLRIEGVDLAKGEGRWALLLDALVARGAVGNVAAAALGAHVARRGLAAV